MQISGAERAITVSGYLPILALLYMVVKIRRDSMFVQFHVRQAFVLFLLIFAIDFLLIIIIAAVEPLATILFGVIAFTWAYFLVFMLAGMVKAAKGERYRMPLVADVALMMRL